MSGIESSLDDHHMSETICCEKPVTEIKIETPRGALTMTRCRRCETTRWYDVDGRTTLAGVLDVAKAGWNRRAAAPTA
jgi:hypothetical protein